MLLGRALFNSVVYNGIDGLGDSPSGLTSTTTASPRYVPGDELALMLSGLAYTIIGRIRIADPAGILRDYSTRDNINWIESIRWSNTIDSPVGQAQVKLLREPQFNSPKSLSPFKTGSVFNRIPFVASDLSQGTGPSIDAGRRILIDVATKPLGATLADVGPNDWHPVFAGYVDSVDVAKNPIEVDCRDLGAALVDTLLTVSSLFPGTVGADTIQAVLIFLLAIAPTDVGFAQDFYVPTAPDPAVAVPSFKWTIEPVMDAVQRCAGLIGWDLRYRYVDELRQWKLVFRDPGRSKTTPDWTITSKNYIDVKQFKIDRIPIRNDVTIWYRPDNNLGVDRAYVRTFDPESVRRYGRRSMVVNEDDTSPINSAESALLMAQLIVFDIARPIADKIIEMPFFWPVQLHDLIRLPPNLVHADETFDLSVTSVSHELSANNNRTTVAVRGKPAGSYWGWLLRKPVTGVTNPATGADTPNGFGGLAQTPNYATNHIQFDWAWGGDPTASFKLWVQRGTTGFFLQASPTTGTFTYDYDAVTDIEPFRPPPDPPQAPVAVDFYVQAIVGGVVVATSATCSATYGFGP